MSNSILRDKAKEFAKNIVFLCRNMKSDHKEMVLINQLLRSGTSIGANIHEAQCAQGTKDFISKLEIAQKECYETEYWLIWAGVSAIYKCHIKSVRSKLMHGRSGSSNKVVITTVDNKKFLR